MPIIYIKIDGSLVKTILDDKTSYHLMKNIINFAKELQIKTIAKFVWKKEIFSKVRQMGIDYSQGYFISKPCREIPLNPRGPDCETV